MQREGEEEGCRERERMRDAERKRCKRYNQCEGGRERERERRRMKDIGTERRSEAKKEYTYI